MADLGFEGGSNLSIIINSQRLLIEFVKYINYIRTHILCRRVSQATTAIASPMAASLHSRPSSPSRGPSKTNIPIHHPVRITMISSLQRAPRTQSLTNYSMAVFIKITIFRKLEKKTSKMIRYSMRKEAASTMKI